MRTLTTEYDERVLLEEINNLIIRRHTFQETADLLGISLAKIRYLRKKYNERRLRRRNKNDERSNTRIGSRLTIEKAREIKRMIKDGESPKYIAHVFKVSVSLVSRIRSGGVWRHA